MRASPTPSRRARFSLLASLGVVTSTGLTLGTNPTADRGIKAVAPAPREERPSDAQLRTMILGRWRTESNGTRVVMNRADGTASMELTFDFLASLLFGQRMTLQLTWSVDRGELVYTIQSGEPRESVERLIAKYGSQAEYRFQAIGDRRMHLVRVKNADEQYVWTRVD